MQETPNRQLTIRRGLLAEMIDQYQDCPNIALRLENTNYRIKMDSKDQPSNSGNSKNTQIKRKPAALIDGFKENRFTYSAGKKQATITHEWQVAQQVSRQVKGPSSRPSVPIKNLFSKKHSENNKQLISQFVGNQKWTQQGHSAAQGEVNCDSNTGRCNVATTNVHLLRQVGQVHNKVPDNAKQKQTTIRTQRQSAKVRLDRKNQKTQVLDTAIRRCQQLLETARTHRELKPVLIGVAKSPLLDRDLSLSTITLRQFDQGGCDQKTEHKLEFGFLSPSECSWLRNEQPAELNVADNIAVRLNLFQSQKSGQQSESINGQVYQPDIQL